jgi:hypothetical protein
MVGPGYGVDCCGRDIVVCDPIYYDFKCDQPFDPCCPERTTGRQPQPLINDAAGIQERKLGCIPVSELRAFDLCMRFEEKLSGGQRPLARGNCRSLDECQYTRVIETGKLYAKEVADPYTPKPRVLQDKYWADLKLYLAEVEKYRNDAKGLLEWISGKLHSFCFVEDCLCEYTNTQPTTVRMEVWQPKTPAKKAGKARAAIVGGNTAVETIDFDDLFFYIVQDWRNHYFQCLCAPCEGGSCDDDSIPLARVWVRNKTEGNCKICKVVQVDSYPPYRRLLSRDCGPNHPSCIDLSRYVWRDANDVAGELRRMGFTAEFTLKNSHEALDALRSNKDDFICAIDGSSIKGIACLDLSDTPRVVCFGGG